MCFHVVGWSRARSRITRDRRLWEGVEIVNLVAGLEGSQGLFAFAIALTKKNPNILQVFYFIIHFLLFNLHFFFIN